MWNAIEASWEEMFNALKEYKYKNKHCNVPRTYKIKNLANWVNAKRHAYKKGKLRKDYVRCLNDIGFVWNPNDFAWNVMFNELIKFKNKYGHCNVSSRYKDKQLANWVIKQRTNYYKSSISEENIKRLNNVGFVFNPLESYWENMFKLILEYKDKYGNCNVPQNWPENKQLGFWVGTQRSAFNKGELSKDYVDRLQNIGFEWDAIRSYWEKMFSSLLEYKNKYGHCNVPQDWLENKKLGKWVRTQRVSYTKGKLEKDCIKRLNDIDFVWNTLVSNWEEMFNMLVEYKNKYGNCNVPTRWPENPKLANWVAKQRRDSRKGKLVKDRTKRLNNIGFSWFINKGVNKI